MKQEKSCGALVYRLKGSSLMILLLRHRHGGHWAFPKGHVEGAETEHETALREVFEETGLTISLRDGFRQAVEYSPKPGVRKQVVYFLGLAQDERLVRQEEEISELGWVTYEEACRRVTFENDKNLLAGAKAYLDQYGLGC